MARSDGEHGEVQVRLQYLSGSLPRAVKFSDCIVTPDINFFVSLLLMRQDRKFCPLDTRREIRY